MNNKDKNARPRYQIQKPHQNVSFSNKLMNGVICRDKLPYTNYHYSD